MKPETPESAARSALENLTALLDLERMARATKRPSDLAFMMVNESSRVLPYRTAVHWVTRGRKVRVTAVSGSSDVERTAPFVQWLERALTLWIRAAGDGAVFDVNPESLPPKRRPDDEEWFPGSGLVLAFRDRNAGKRRQKRPFAGLLLLRAPVWSEQDKAVAAVLADAYGHAGLTLDPKAARPKISFFSPKVLGFAVLVLLISSFIIPMRLSVVAPAEVTARDATVVSAPFASTIESIAVAPNAAIKAGDLLFTLDQTEVRARFESTRQELGVAKARYRRAIQGAFSDNNEKADVAILLEEIRVKEIELDYTRTLMNLSNVYAERAGVAVFADANDWIGKPVTVGERVMLVSDPNETWLEVSVPASDAINLAIGANVLFFTNVNPLEPLNAAVTQTSFEAEVGPEGNASYRVKAVFVDEASAPRLGLKGTAKIFGDEVNLFYFLFRRPLSIIRQYLVF